MPRPESPGCWVTFFEHQSFTRGRITFHGPVSIARLDPYRLDNGKSAGDEIDSLVVGPNAWLEVYEDEDYHDTCRKYGPGRQVPDLDQEGIGDNIDSFRLHDCKPPNWD